MSGMKYSRIEFFPPYLPDIYSLRTLLAWLSCVKQSLRTLPCCFFTAADDPTDHVSSLRLGSVQQRHHCDLLVRNTVQGIPHFSLSRTLRAGRVICFLFLKWARMMVEKQCKAQPWVELCHTVILMTIWCLLLFLPGTLSTLGHPDFQLHHWRLVSIHMICSAVITCLWIKII